MKMQSIRRSEGIKIARRLKKQLQSAGIAFDAIYLFGSVARDEAHEWSDIDVAILCKPFRETRHEENMEIRRARWDIDVRIEPFCLHPEDFQNKYFGLAQEIKRTGVEV
jgi:predicted nucleotidyltransferase